MKWSITIKMHHLSTWIPAFFSAASPLRSAAAVSHLTHSPDDSIFCSSNQSLYFLPRLHKALSALPALRCTVTSCFPLKQTQSQNSKHPLLGFPYFILPPFFFNVHNSKIPECVWGGWRREGGANGYVSHPCFTPVDLLTYFLCFSRVPWPCWGSAGLHVRMSEVEQIYYISDDEDDEDDDGDDGDDEDEGRPGVSQPHLQHTCL